MILSHASGTKAGSHTVGTYPLFVLLSLSKGDVIVVFETEAAVLFVTIDGKRFFECLLFLLIFDYFFY